MAKAVIQIAMAEGRDVDGKYIPLTEKFDIAAEIVGQYAVHRTVYWDSNKEAFQIEPRGDYTVTHILSGCRIIRQLSKQDALKIAGLMASVDLDTPWIKDGCQSSSHELAALTKSILITVVPQRFEKVTE